VKSLSRNLRRYLKRVQSLARTVSLSSILVATWVANLLPYIPVKRSAFLYHYLPGLYYAEILLAVVVNALPARLRRATVILVS